MIDCDRCAESIGTLKDPICVLPSDAPEYADGTVCKTCFERIMDRPPRADEQDYDPNDVVPTN